MRHGSDTEEHRVTAVVLGMGRKVTVRVGLHFFFYWWGRREPRLSHFSLRGRLYSNPCFSSPVHFQRRSTPDGVGDLY
jgi:hypothetical protein